MTSKHRKVTLFQRSNRSFELSYGTIDELVVWLLDRGFKAAPRRDRHEHGRLQSSDQQQLAVIYKSGAVLTQGKNWQQLAQLLNDLVATQGDLFAREESEAD